MSNDNETPTTPTAADQERVTATVGGKTYTITGMSTEAGLELYNALPAEHKAQAEQIARILQTYAKLQSVASKHGLDTTQLAKDWIASASETKLARDSVAGFGDAQKAALRELGPLQEGLGDLVRMVPGGDAFVGGAAAAKTIAGVGGVVLGGSTAVADGAWNGAPRIWNLASTLYSEGVGKVFGYGSATPEDPAKAFAAAVVALRMEETGKRNQLPMFDWNPLDDQQSQFGSNPLQYASAGASWVGEWLAQTMPGLAKYVVAAYRWVTFKGEERPSFGTLVEQAEADILKQAETSPANWQRFSELADAAMWERDGKKVSDALLRAGNVAGMQITEEVAEAAVNASGTHRDENGNDVTLKNGQVESVVTPGQRVGQAWNTLTGDGPLHEQALRVGGAAWATTQGARGLAEGMARQSLTRPAKAAEAATEEVNRLKGKIDAAETSPKTSKFQFWKADEAKVGAWKEAMEAAKEEAVEKGKLAAERTEGASKFTRAAATPLEDINKGSKAKGLWNLPRGIGRVGGDVVSWAFGKAADMGSAAVEKISKVPQWFTGGNAASAAQATEEVAEVAAKATATTAAATSATAAQSGWMARMARSAQSLRNVPIVGKGIAGVGGVLGFLGVAGLVTSPAIAAVETAVAENGVVRAASGANTTALAATSLSALKIGVMRAGAIAAPVYHAGELGVAIARDDARTQNRAGWQLATVGAGAATGAATGAGLGMLGGPLAPATVPIGAIGGAVWGTIAGGLASIFTGSWAEKRYDRNHPQTTVASNDGAAGPADKGLQVAAIDQTKQAQDAARKAALAFRNSNVQSGAILRNEDGSLRALNFGANGQEINAPTATV